MNGTILELKDFIEEQIIRAEEAHESGHLTVGEFSTAVRFLREVLEYVLVHF